MDKRTRLVNLWAVAAVVAALPSCAMVDGDNRRALHYLDEHLAPDGAATQVLLAPVALPAALAAGVADAVVVHPATQLDDAWRDTVDVFWSYEETSPFRRVLWTPLSGLATPPAFVLIWAARAVFDIDDNEPESADGAEEALR